MQYRISGTRDVGFNHKRQNNRRFFFCLCGLLRVFFRFWFLYGHGFRACGKRLRMSLVGIAFSLALGLNGFKSRANLRQGRKADNAHRASRQSFFNRLTQKVFHNPHGCKRLAAYHKLATPHRTVFYNKRRGVSALAVDMGLNHHAFSGE